jgi:opacity protein-like surface antigen
MLRLARLVTPFFLLGCASVRTNPLSFGAAASISGTEAPRVETPSAPDAATEDFTGFALDPQAPPMAPPPMTPPPRPRQRVTLKGGYYGSSEDGIDDGYIFNVALLQPMSDSLAREVEIGYLDADGSHNGVKRDVWAIPLMVNGRFNIPVGEKVELYGGVGLGTMYYDANAKAGGVSASADGFLFAGDAFFGGDIRLGDSLYVGLEGKYYVTDNASELDGGLDAYVVMLTVGFAK